MAARRWCVVVELSGNAHHVLLYTEFSNDLLNTIKAVHCHTTINPHDLINSLSDRFIRCMVILSVLGKCRHELATIDYCPSAEPDPADHENRGVILSCRVYRERESCHPLISALYRVCVCVRFCIANQNRPIHAS
jgi:hypothetical protein